MAYRTQDFAVDLLIGIDHVHMHAGETRQVDHLLARKSPLGWVVFGGKPEQICDVTSILHVKYAPPIDLTDFWTTEAMGVAVKHCVCDADKLTQAEREKAKLIEESCFKVESQWMILYPWRKAARQQKFGNKTPRVNRTTAEKKS